MARGRKRLVAGWGLIGFGVAVAGVFVASRWQGAILEKKPPWKIHVWGGQLFLIQSVGDSRNARIHFQTDKVPQPVLVWIIPYKELHEDEGFNIGILSMQYTPESKPYSVWYVCVVLWPIALASFAGGVPLMMFGRRVRRRAQQGQCPACGYSLAGLVAGAACPECGKGKVPLTA